jgi:hypothetical protein
MATKSQLKTYFEKGDIPTSTQFGELIDSLLSVPSEDTMDRPNQNLFFGNGEENPYMQGIRTISIANDTNVINMWIFTTHNVNDAKLAIPMFILSRSSTTNPSLLPTTETLRYCIPTKMNIDDFVNAALDCNTSANSELMTQIYTWEFKPFEKEDVGNRYILNVLTNISGAFSSFKFDLADVNIGGTAKTLPIRLIGIIDNDTRLTVTGIYNIKNGVNWEEFENAWNNVTRLLKVTNGTVTSTNAMVVTRINTIKDNYMIKQ